MKFGMKVESDEINHFPKFGCDGVISCPAVTRIKIFSQHFTLVCALTVDVIAT